MVFRDRANKHEPKYCESLSLEEFGTRYYNKLDDFCRLVIFYIILLGARDLAFAPRPFGKMKTYSGAIEALLSKSVMISPELLDEIESFIKENAQLGYATKEEFIRYAIRFRLTWRAPPS